MECIEKKVKLQKKLMETWTDASVEIETFADSIATKKEMIECVSFDNKSFIK